jgi:Zn-dependent protease
LATTLPPRRRWHGWSAANFALVAIASAAMVGGMMTGIFERPEGFSMLQMVAPTTELAGGLATFLSILFVENVLLGAFNLIPVPPLDGATALGLILPESAALAFVNFMQQPGFSLLGLVIAWRAFDYVFPPVYSVALQVFYFSVNLVA